MEIFFDDIIFRMQKRGGISRLFSEIIDRLAIHEAVPDIHLMSEQPVDSARFKNKHLIKQAPRPLLAKYYRPGYPGKPIAVPETAVKNRKISKKIWHSTYYSMIEPWDGYSVVTVVDMIYELFPELFCSPADQKFMQLKKACVESSDAVITISRTSANDIIRYYDVDPSCVYPIHLSASQAFKCLEKDTGGNRASTPFFLYVGGRYHYKNFNFFIRAFSRWSQRKEVDLYIVGAPLTDEERKIISSFQIEDQIYCFSDISDDELCELYNRATALVYPSLYEGFGIPLLEAMACGCTVIASSIPSTHEVAGDFPIYFDPEEEVSLRDAFTAALTKEITANDINDAIEWAKKYSWEKTVNQTFNVYKALLV